MTKKEDLTRIVEHITKEDGFINAFIANSGISGPTMQGMPKEPSLQQYQEFLWKTDPTYFSDTFQVNTVAVWFSVVAFLGLLDAGNKKGNVEQPSQVIATTSIGSFNRIPLAGFAYSASKAGATFMMKQFATALVPYGVWIFPVPRTVADSRS